MTKKEYNYIVNRYFNESPYAQYNKTRLDVVMNFLGDFLRKYAFLIEHNKTYKSKDVSRLIRRYNDGVTYEENEDNIKIKNCVDWKKEPFLKAELIFYSYICKNYTFNIKKNYCNIELIADINTFN